MFLHAGALATEDPKRKDTKRSQGSRRYSKNGPKYCRCHYSHFIDDETEAQSGA